MRFFVGDGFLFFYLLFISFISWNYFGSLFFVFGYYLFKHINNSINLNLKNYLLKTVVIISSWELGALSWMLEIDKGIFGLIGHLIFTLLVFILYYFLSTKSKCLNGFIFIFIWITYELIQNFIVISFPWLIIGNVFANQTYLIQWYEYTSVIGGSIWFLCSSYIIFTFLNDKKKLKYFLFLLFLFLPIIFSFFLLKKNTRMKEFFFEKKVVLYNPEFNKKKIENSELAFFLYSKIKGMHNVDLFIAPEHTFNNINIDGFKKSLTKKFLTKLLNETSVKELYFGTSMYKSNKKKNIFTNGSIFLTPKKTYLRIKKKLVPFNEYIPKFFSQFINKKSFEFNIKDSEVELILNKKITPLICYEVFFPFFVYKRVKNTKIIFLISSEKFLKSSVLGRKQYDNIIKLRCIENRINMIKCSSHGSSYLINSLGQIEEESRKQFNVFNIKI